MTSAPGGFGPGNRGVWCAELLAVARGWHGTPADLVVRGRDTDRHEGSTARSPAGGARA